MRARFNAIIEEILTTTGQEDESGKLALVIEMTDLLAGWTLFDLAPSINSGKESPTEGGKAVTPWTAARCALEFMRTQRFLKGVDLALREGLARRDAEGRDGPLEVLYAGSGPFGTILLPLLPRYAARDIKVTVLDIHQASLDALADVITVLDIGEHIRAIECVDILRWTPPGTNHYDVIISETMMAALRAEPQVAIFAHLVPALKADGVLIPQAVHLDAEVVSREGAPIPLGRAFTLDRASSEAIHGGDRAVLQRELMVTDLPEDCDTLRVTTEIQVQGDVWLRGSDCSLNLPLTMRGACFKPTGRVSFRYELSADPVLVVDAADLRAEAYEVPLEAEDRSLLGVPHLARCWSKIQIAKAGRLDRALMARDGALDQRCAAALGLDWIAELPGLYGLRSRQAFEALILERNGGPPTAEQVARIEAILAEDVGSA